MARNTKKHYHYVLVLTDTGAVFVTDIGDHHTAFWDREQPPMEMSAYFAHEMVIGLTLNFHLAYHVDSPYPIKNQPYNYKQGGFKWEWKDGTEETEGEEETT